MKFGDFRDFRTFLALAPFLGRAGPGRDGTGRDRTLSKFLANLLVVVDLVLVLVHSIISK